MNDPRADSQPRRLLRTFALLALGSAALILLLAGFGVHAVYQRDIVEDAQQRSVDSARAIFALQRHLLAGISAAGLGVRVRKEDIPVLDESLRAFFAPFGVYKVKLYSADRRVAYSTDRDIIGKLDGNNETLERALRGEVVSKRYLKDQVTDLRGEQKFRVEVVGTYLPLQDDAGRVIGSFEVYSDLSHYRRDMANVMWPTLLTLFAVLAAVFSLLYLLMRQGARRVIEVQDELQRIAVTDSLTGIFNRRYLMSRAGEEFAKLRRRNQERREHGGDKAGTVGLVMLDVDHFKDINDRYGHQAGDEVLRQIAARLRETVRTYDIVGRYGGEEFLLLLPHTNLNGTARLAQRIMQALRERPCCAGDGGLPVTVSIGVTCSDGREGDDMELAHKRADMALYRAKQDGRDRIVVMAQDDAE